MEILIGILKIMGVSALAVIGFYCIRLIIHCVANIRALIYFDKHPHPLNQRHGIVFNEKTGKLEADQSPILPFK